MIEDEELLTAAEAARVLGLSRQRVTHLAHEGRIGRQVANRFYVFTRAELEAYRAGPKNKGGRPKNDLSQTMKYETPALAGA